MTYLGLSDEELAAHVSLVMPRRTGTGERGSTGHLDAAEPGHARHRFSRAVLSALAEPGDSDAGALVGSIGPVSALRVIVEGWGVPRILAEVREANAAAAEVLGPRLDNALERWRPRASLKTAVRAFEAAGRLRALVVTPEDEHWPKGFDDLGDGAPHALWVRGDHLRLAELAHSVALVGARAATGYGEHIAMEASAGLADRGFATVSGGAYGIDGAVHRASLASDATTIAFLAGGVDRLYPAGHTELLRRVAEHGLLIAELPCGSSPTKWRFLMRNRLIAAASTATVVVEAGRRSGSLNTAGHAAAIGRPLGAVPGPVTSPASAGCHRLIREYGAECVTNADEMAELAGVVPPQLAARSGRRELTTVATATPETVRLLDALKIRSSLPVSELVIRSGMSARDVIAVLGTLEADGRVSERNGGWVKSPRG